MTDPKPFLGDKYDEAVVVGCFFLLVTLGLDDLAVLAAGLLAVVL